MRARHLVNLLEPRRLLAFVPYDGDLVEQTVFSGLSQPVAMEFATDGRVFVSEKAGIIKTFDSLSDTTASVALDISDQVNSAGDRGLLGLALSPNFANDHHVFLLYTFDGDIGSSVRTTYTDQANVTVSGKLVRYTFTNGQLTDATPMIHDWPAQSSSHTVGHLQFGGDGYLYASGGDGASFNNVDYGQGGDPFGDPTNEGGAVRAQDVRTDGDPAGLDGTIIRIDATTGAGAPGNPFAASGDANKRRVLAFGLRNPYRFNFRPNTGEVWIGDVGWNGYEELNRLTSFGTNNAPNFQWPALEGPGWQASYKAANLPLLSGLYDNSVPSVSPYYSYSHSNRVDVTGDTNEPVGGSSITGVAFYTANFYPYQFENALFVADYARQTIYTMRPGNDGLPDPSTAKLVRTGVRAVELQIGPGGDVYYADIGSGKIVRLTSKGPIARLGANVTSGDAPLTVNFSAADSTDPDEGDALTFAWDLDNDGQYDDATGAYVTRTFASNGTYTVHVRATDYGGLTDTASLAIHVGSAVPVPAISSPSSSTRWRVGQTINFSGGATDAEDGTLAASRLTWQVVLRHANEDNPNTPAHDHVIATYNGVTGGSFTTIDHDHPSWLELRLTAVDSDGNSVTTTRRLDPQTITVNVDASTPGVQVAFNDRVLTTPFSRTVIVGSRSSLSVPTQQDVGGLDWRFASWQDDAKNTRQWTAPSSTSSLHVNGRLFAWRRLDGVPIGGNDVAAGSGNYTRDLAFDGDLTTGYRSAQTGSRIGIDFGGSRSVGRIRYAPLMDAYSMVDGRFEGSNKSNFSGATTLYQIETEPTAGTLTEVTADDGLVVGSFRYLRFVAANGSIVSLAEMEAYTSQAVESYDGRLFGSAAKSNSSLANAADNRQATSYTASKESGSWIALDLGEPRQIDLVRFAPDLKAPSTMRGGTFQASNAADFKNATTILSINATPAAGMHERAVSVNGSYRYVRYLGPSKSASRIAEFEVIGLVVPQTPAALGAVKVLTHDASNGVRLTWADSSMIETGYRVRRSVDGGSWKTVANLDANATLFTDSAVSAGRRYSYRMIPLNAFGYGGSTDVTTTIDKKAIRPAAPSRPTLTSESRGVYVAWTDNANNETGYRIERRFAGYIWESIATAAANATNYLDVDAGSNVTYEYRVVAINAVGEATGPTQTIET